MSEPRRPLILLALAMLAAAPPDDGVPGLKARARELMTAADREIGAPGTDMDKLMDLSRQGLEVNQALARLAADADGRREAARELAKWYYIRGRTEVVKGKADDALGHLESARDGLRRVEPRGNEMLAECLNELGALYWNLGDYRRTYEAFAAAAEVYPRVMGANPGVEARLGLAVLRHNLGTLAMARGDDEGAFPSLESARQALQELSRSIPPGADPRLNQIVLSDLAKSLDNLAFLAIRHGRHDDARRYLDEASALFDRLYPGAKFPDGHPDVARCLNHQGLLAMSLGDFDTARDRLTRALAMLRARYPEGHPDVARCLENLGMLAVWRGDTAAAVGRYDEARAVCEQQFPAARFPQGHPELARTLYFLGESQRRRGDDAPSRRNLTRSLEMTQGLVEAFASAFSEVEGLSYASLMVPAPRDSLLALDAGRADRAGEDYAHVWRSKAAVTRISQARSRAWSKLVSGPSGELAGEYRRTLDRLSYLSIDDNGSPPRGGHDRLRELTERKEDLERQLTRIEPGFGRERAMGRKPYADLIGLLPEGSAFVDVLRYATFDPSATPGARLAGHYTAFVLAPGRGAVRVELGPAEAIERDVAAWRAEIDAHRAGDAGARLRAVWARLEAHFPPATSTVILSPDGALVRLPWAALPGESPDARLVDRYTVLNAPHGPALLELLSEPPAPAAPAGAFLVVGGVPFGAHPAATAAAGGGAATAPAGLGRLPDPTRLIADLRRSAGRLTVQPLTGDLATVPNVCRALPGASRAYIETHGFAHEPPPPTPPAFVGPDGGREPIALDKLRLGPVGRHPLLLSGLLLGDGPLTAAAIKALPLDDLDLAVLGACETGLGTVADGESVFSLERAFHQAGARNVVASLWKVDPTSTRALITEFHRNLADGRMSKPEALRQAQRWLIRSGVGASDDPYYWAGWVASGDPRPVGRVGFTSAPAPPTPRPVPAPRPPRGWSPAALAGSAALAASGLWLLFRRRPAPPTRSPGS